MLGVAITCLGGAWYAFTTYHTGGSVAGVIAALFILPGLFTQQPNTSRVLTFFGRYAGSISEPGFHWANPLAIRRRLSLRVENFHSEQAKVNDADGNPIEIGAVVVWRVADTARAAFDVEKYQRFVAVQFDTAIRGLASRYPYDNLRDDGPSLRGSPMEIATELRKEAAKRVLIAGVEVLDAQISNLAYAPEIAHAMLKRQQAQAIIAARKQIVDGAVGMVEHALRRLGENGVVHLDEERKAQMVNNLMVVLTSDSESQPVINAGG